MKLELKHICGYIPYGLDAMIEDVVCEIEGVDLHVIESVIAERVNYKVDEIKPILRPLSDLKKEECFDLHKELCEIIGVIQCEQLLLAVQHNYDYVFNLKKLNALEEFMYKNHFDWQYKLIENGLVIDRNTLISK
jgi:hypothetical protein